MARRNTSFLKRVSSMERLNQLFDLEILDLHRHSQYLAIDTPSGKFRLIPTVREEGFLIFLLSVQQHLKINGFEKFASIYQSKEANPFIKYRSQLLILTDYVEGEEFTFTLENIQKGMEILAEFHNAARELNPMPGSEFKVSWGKWPDQCFQEVNDMVKLKTSRKDRKVRDFDVKFGEHIDYLIERGLLAWRRFNHENYRKILKKEMETRSFSLHSVNANKFKLVDGEMIITDMDRIRYEIQVYDLANFLTEILQNTDMPISEVAEYIKYYTAIRPLSFEEREAIIAFLLYPKGLYRLIRHHYSKRTLKDEVKRFNDQVQLMGREEELIAHLEMEQGELR